MDKQRDIDIEMTLAARSVLYGLLHRVFADVPDTSLAELEQSEVVQTACEVYRDIAGRFGKMYDLAVPALRDDDGNNSATVDGEYNRLFVGVGKPAVSTWESVYLTGNSALFQENTLAVRRFFERYNLQSRDYPRVADDHIAIELAFMREMSMRTADNPSAQDILEAQNSFLQSHLGLWVGQFAQEVEAKSKVNYYRAYARFLAEFIETDSALLGWTLQND